MSRLIIIFVIVFLFPAALLAQEKELYMQLSGMIKNDLNEPVPYAYVVVKKNQRSTVSDHNGLYTIIVEPNDTVYFSSIGYKRVRVTLPPQMTSRHLLRDVYMEVDTVMLKTVVIFPWKTYAEFKTAVINTELPAQEEMEAAQLNIALIQTQILLSYSNTPNMNFRNVMMQQYEKNMTKGQTPYYGVLDVMKWAQFIKALKNGEFKRKKSVRKY